MAQDWKGQQANNPSRQCVTKLRPQNIGKLSQATLCWNVELAAQSFSHIDILAMCWYLRQYAPVRYFVWVFSARDRIFILSISFLIFPKQLLSPSIIVLVTLTGFTSCSFTRNLERLPGPDVCDWDHCCNFPFEQHLSLLFRLFSCPSCFAKAKIVFAKGETQMFCWELGWSYDMLELWAQTLFLAAFCKPHKREQEKSALVILTFWE